MEGRSVRVDTAVIVKVELIHKRIKIQFFENRENVGVFNRIVGNTENAVVFVVEEDIGLGAYESV